MVLAAIGGIGAAHICLRSIYVPTAPRKVARLPKIISSGIHPVKRLLRIQPAVRPGIAAGVKNGRIVSASEKRTCTA